MMFPTPGWKEIGLHMSQAMLHYLAEGTCICILRVTHTQFVIL